MNARRATKRILAAHPPNLLTDFFDTGGRPRWPRQTFHVQNSRKPLRCQPMTVSRLTITRAERQPIQNSDNRGQRNRSAGVSFGRLTERCATQIRISGNHNVKRCATAQEPSHQEPSPKLWPNHAAPGGEVLVKVMGIRRSNAPLGS
jgi:hypothetical protein